MNLLSATIYHPLANRLGWLLLHSLWQGALIGICFVLLRFALRKQSAQSRYLAGCVCLVLIAVAPLLTWLMNPGTMQTANGRGLMAPANPSTSVAGPISTLERPYAEGWVGSTIEFMTELLGQLAPWLTTVWLIGVAFYSGRLLRGVWWVRTIRTKETDIAEADLIERLNHLRQRV